MFFFWFAKNKQFSQKKNLSGQIVPFLLVALVILLIAAVATINIGRVSLDKTCSANAADAGALAAASSWASAFNILTEINGGELEFNYDLNYFAYGRVKAEADQHLGEAIRKAGEASFYAAAALGSGSVVPGGSLPEGDLPDCVSLWLRGIAAVVFDSLAASAALDASTETMAFASSVQYLQSLTDSLYEQQQKTFCNSVAFMDNSYINSRKTGLSYAFKNSCIPAKLSESQNDAFSVWMGSETAYEDDSVPFSGTEYFLDSEGKFSRECSWQDKIGQAHTVTAALDLPRITSYELQHTQGNYTQIKDLLDGLIQHAQHISGVLYSTATVLGAAAAMYIATFAASAVAFGFSFCKDTPPPYNCFPAWATACKITWALYDIAHLAQIGIVLGLGIIVGVAAAVSLDSLKSDNDLAYADWATDGNQSIPTCLTCEPCESDAPKDCQPCQTAKDQGLMIVKINDVILEQDVDWPASDWTTLCSTSQQHPPTSSGILATEYPVVTSSSRAKFDAGHGNTPEGGGIDVGKFNDTYDASIVNTE